MVVYSVRRVLDNEVPHADILLFTSRAKAEAYCNDKQLYLDWAYFEEKSNAYLGNKLYYTVQKETVN